MKTIKIKYIDFWDNFDPNDNFFTRLLKKSFDIQIVEENPDFIICSCFGNEFKKYSCPRIVFLGENIFPNFNAYDYALSFEILEYQNRHLRLPLYYVFLDDYLHADKQKYIDNRNDSELKNRKFCNFVYSNFSHVDPIRENFFYKLSKYKQVDSGGRYLNNIDAPIKDKYLFQKQYKFSIAFENSSSIGYTTEKILDAFLARTIPIYWGNKDVSKDFNPESFINVNDYNSLEEVIEVIKELDNNDEKYLKMLNTPYLNNGQFYNNLNDEKILSFFENIFKNPEIIHKDALKNRDINGDLINIKLPLYIKIISLFFRSRNKRNAFRTKFLVKAYNK